MKFGNWVGIPTKQAIPQWDRVKHIRLAGYGNSAVSINALVNRTIIYRPDRVDKWQTPHEMLVLEEGDCEDFAILKRAMLLGGGAHDHDIFLVIGYDTILQANHAVLLVRGAVLDCAHGRILLPEEMPHFRPVMAMNGVGAWVMAQEST